MDAVFAELAGDYPSVPFLRVEADASATEAATSLHAVDAVPTVLFFKGGSVAARVDGADAPRVADTATAVLGAPASAAPASAAAAGESLTPALRARLDALVSASPVVLFMKGAPDAPRCGFSRKVVEKLNAASVPFTHFDILSDADVRAGMKEYSDWPTFPQLYANGELVGGCDIVCEMDAAELKTATAGGAA